MNTIISYYLLFPFLNSFYIRLPALYGQCLINCLHTVYQKVSVLLLLQIFHILHEYYCMSMSGISIFISIIIFSFSGGPLLILPCTCVDLIITFILFIFLFSGGPLTIIPIIIFSTANFIITDIYQFWYLFFHV